MDQFSISKVTQMDHQLLGDLELFLEKLKGRKIHIVSYTIKYDFSYSPFCKLDFMVVATKTVNGHIFSHSLNFVDILASEDNPLKTLEDFLENHDYCLTKDNYIVPSVFKDCGLNFEELSKTDAYTIALELLK